jgi:hypothetical protein
MPLSDHEQRLLDQIEQTLRADDPGLASSMQAARPLPHVRTLWVMAAAGLVAGIAMMTAGLQVAGHAGTILGVIGFLFIVAGIECLLRALARTRRERGERIRKIRKRPAS